MPRKASWRMTPGEELVLAKSLASDIETGQVLTGTPTVTVRQKTGGSWTDKTSDFTIADEQVNASALTDQNGDTIAIGHGVVFTLTAPTGTEGEYVVELSCGADDGTTPKANVGLSVTYSP